MENEAFRYVGWWDKATVPDKLKERVRGALRRARENQPQYERLAAVVEMPWSLIACIHELEAGASMDRHIANGDPLSDYTKHVPKGQPKGLSKPWTWEEAAVVELQEVRKPADGTWTIRAMLDAAERFNGLGYRRKGRSSPYLTASTDLDKGGKYVADGVYDESAKSSQVGVLALLRALADDGESLPRW